jgi:hypothetical protein
MRTTRHGAGGVTRSPNSAEIEDVRLHVFIAQSLAVRTPTGAEFDEVPATIGYVRGALDEIEVLVPSLDDEVGRELREGCARLNEAVEIVAGRGAHSLSRRARRQLSALHSAGVEHMARALDLLGASSPLSAHTTLDARWILRDAGDAGK